jgi:LmbE family N-acetylglucosaminyl deacetylase
VSGPPRVAALLLSPHYDDAVFSAAGTMVALAREGRVVAINVFGEGAGGKREAEERRAASLLGFESEALPFRDAPLRTPIHRSVLTPHLPLRAGERGLIAPIAAALAARVAALLPDRVYAPLGYGGHVDHVLVREAAIRAVPPGVLRFYEDAPYCLSATPGSAGLTASFLALLTIARRLNPAAFRPGDGTIPLRPALVDVKSTIALRIAGIETYRSQARQFFRDRGGIPVALAGYSRFVSGGRLEWAERHWRPA